MRRKKLFKRLYLPHLLVTLLALMVISCLSAVSFRKLYIEEKISALKTHTRLLSPYFTSPLLSPADSLKALCQLLSTKTDARITVISPTGEVLSDSDEDAKQMDNHRDRPEFQQAVSRGWGSSLRYSHTLNEEMLYLALPIRAQGEMRAVLRVALPHTAIKAGTGRYYLFIAITALLLALLSALIYIHINRRVGRQVTELIAGAKRIAAGARTESLPLPESQEMAQLAQAFNEMVSELSHKLGVITYQRNQQEAVLSSMNEGVLAVDGEGRIISLNDAAKRMFQIQMSDLGRRKVVEAIRHPELQRLITHTLSTDEPVEGELTHLNPPDERFLRVHCTVLKDDNQSEQGAVVVLNDITRIRRLEVSRRDFIANVSHELRTPITSIRGFVDTLLDGTLNNPPDVKRFLNIIDRQARQLQALIDDLLELARIERLEEGQQINLVNSSIKGILELAVQQCTPMAQSAGVLLQMNVSQDEMLPLDPLMMERAVVNLIHNAVHHTPSGGKVEVALHRDKDEAVITVQDWGSGIAGEHLPRLFERFYRVEKGRGRHTGGTGLGLAIVKHIALAHGGEVNVVSEPNKGSSFSIRIPRGSADRNAQHNGAD